jgi:hypothetical protein
MAIGVTGQQRSSLRWVCWPVSARTVSLLTNHDRLCSVSWTTRVSTALLGFSVFSCLSHVSSSSSPSSVRLRSVLFIHDHIILRHRSYCCCCSVHLLDVFPTCSLDFSGPHAKTLVELLGHGSLLLHRLDRSSLRQWMIVALGRRPHCGPSWPPPFSGAGTGALGVCFGTAGSHSCSLQTQISN